MSTRRDRSILVLGTGAVIFLAASAARAQSVTASVSAQYPVRLVGGQSAAVRPANLNPTGINYADCLADMAFQYSVLLSGFPGPNMDVLQVWATNGTDPCVFDSARGVDNPDGASCWLLDRAAPNGQPSYQVSIPVRALVGPQSGSIPAAGTLVTDLGPEACQTQPSDAATSITVWFVVVGSGGQVDNTATSYSAPVITADVVGPPAPAINPIAPGDTEFGVTWVTTSDADTAGYDVFIDPPPGGPVDAAGVALAPRTLYCPDTGAPAASMDASELDAEGGSAEGDADLEALDSAVDSGCTYLNGGVSAPPNTGSACTSIVLTTSSVLVGGAVAPVATDTAVVDAEAGSVVEADSSVAEEPGVGGISTIPCQYLVGASCPAGSPAYTNTGPSTVTGETNAAYTIKGLTNGKTYDVVVAAVDGSGNVGPASTCVLEYPAVVNDFFTVYRQAGGQAGGSFCALEAVGEPAGAPIVGVAFGAMAFTMARRRRGNRR